MTRRELLQKEKELTRQLDRLSAERRALPWVRVEAEYVFDTPEGKRTLAELFDGRSQLIVYHFMLAPGWKEGCDGCSFLADHFDGPNLHLPHHDVTLMAVSRAPLHEIEAFKKRMGWRFRWASSFGTRFNYDFHVSFTEDEIARGQAWYNYRETRDAGEEMPGISVFYRSEAGEVFHTYSAYARGLDILIGAHSLLDLTPKGRNETTIMDWVRHHDRYENAGTERASCCSHEQP
jgi:predicted dithiol-disulfide oxidoreductase (DUF899 family)